MRSVGDFAQLLGAPVREAEGHLIDEIARSWSIRLPEDFLEVAGAYGDTVISDPGSTER